MTRAHVRLETERRMRRQRLPVGEEIRRLQELIRDARALEQREIDYLRLLRNILAIAEISHQGPGKRADSAL